MTQPKSHLDHPCKQTCSGWQQGFEAGHQRFLNEDDNVWKRKYESACKSLEILARCWDEIADELCSMSAEEFKDFIEKNRDKGLVDLPKMGSPG